MGKVRNHHFDNIKALLIFLVVLGHTLKKFGATDEAVILYKIIFSFHMPAFLFVSGYFAKCNAKRVLSRLFPLYILFQVLQYVENFLIAWVTTGQPRFVRIQFFTPVWTLWYLMAIMIFQLFLPVFDTEKKKKQAGFLILSFVLGLAIGLTPDTDNFMSMSRVFVFLPFFLLGYYENKSRFLLHFGKKKYPRAAKGISAAAGVFLIAFFIIYGKSISAKNFYGTESYTDIYSVKWRILAWIIAFVWVMILLIWIPERQMGYVGTIGCNTLPVYLLHSLTLLILVKTALPDMIHGNLFGILILSGALTFVLSWNGFEKMLRKIRIPMK